MDGTPPRKEKKSHGGASVPRALRNHAIRRGGLKSGKLFKIPGS